MTLEYTTEQHGLICNLLHQAICEQRPEPDFDPEELGFTGDAERAFALAILEDVLGMRWELKCPVCYGYDPQSYVVHNTVWAEAGLESDGGGWVHLSCLSRRLGRPLSQADFPADVPANDWRPWELPMMRVCLTRGCPNTIPIVPGRKTPSRCPACRRAWSSPPPANSYAYGSGWQAIRKKVFVRDGYWCQLRYLDICVGRASQVDHIVQPEAGGTNDLVNLRAVCVRCHARRTGRQGALAKQGKQRRKDPR